MTLQFEQAEAGVDRFEVVQRGSVTPRTRVLRLRRGDGRVTNNGEPVALLSPMGGERLALLRRRGAVTPRARVDFARLKRATGIASRDALDDLRGER